MNRDTEKLYYNQRIIVDNMVLTEPRAWQVTKINRVGNNGLCLITLAQEEFNNNTDAFEFKVWDDKDCVYKSEFYHIDDEFPNAKLVGLWADYFSSTVKPEEFKPAEDNVVIYSTMNYSGVKPEIKSGGSYKKITVEFFNANGTQIPLEAGEWKFELKGSTDPISSFIEVLMPAVPTVATTTLPFNTSTDLTDNQIKVKFKKNDMYLHDILVVTYIPNNKNIQSSTVELEIVSL